MNKKNPKLALRCLFASRAIGLFLCFFVMELMTGLLHANVRLPAVISDHMVLQKSSATGLWGQADPREEVTVVVAGVTAKAKADDNGKWRVELDLSKAGSGPFEVIIRGRNEICIRDVVVGDVWVAGGQSNMQFVLNSAAKAREEIAASANSMLRHFKVTLTASTEPLEDCRGEWIVASPEKSGDFTAVGYYFGKMLQRNLGIPIGLVNATMGGTAVELWTSPEALKTFSEFKGPVERQFEAVRVYPDLQKAYIENFGRWMKENGREDRRNVSAALFAAPDAAEGDWLRLTLPIKASKLPAGEGGAVWFRKVVDLPERSAGHLLPLVLGEINGFEEVYWNGKLVAKQTYETLPGASFSRRYDIPENQLLPGRNVLAIRVFSPVGSPALLGRVLKIGTFSLLGEWLTKQEYGLPVLSGPTAKAPSPPPAPPSAQNVAGALFNGTINPILPFTIKGVIWYQGEANASRAWQYRTAFPLLIADWRSRWRQPELPFYFCQLANCYAKNDRPEEANWAELREAQSEALKIPHTGQAVLIDTGESEAIHPLNKKDPGERLARIALAKTYGKNIPWSGPVYKSYSAEDGKIRIKFDLMGSKLVIRKLPAIYDVSLAENKTALLVRNSPESELEGFAICGADRRWVWANARIDGDDVMVWCDSVPKPIAVRYAWGNNPTANLYNEAGLPTSPFRTDDFPSTATRKYLGSQAEKL